MTTSTRRGLLGGLALAGAAPLAAAQVRPSDFSIPDDVLLLNNAGTHPLPNVARQAMADYLTGKAEGTFSPTMRLFGTLPPARKAFAQLINADPDEIAVVQSTLAAENMVVSGLGLREGRGSVVTDALHYDGALYLYRSLERADLQVKIASTCDFGVALKDLDRLIDSRTRLVSVSLTSSINGFTHDLKALCDLAHSRGALVYADIIQAAGAFPIDVKASGVDFAGCGSYKWLMGDCGTAFLYARKEHLGRVIHRDHWGYLQCDSLDQTPFAPPAAKDWPVQFKRLENAQGYFEAGTPAFGVLAGLAASIGFVQSIGVPRIQAHTGALIAHLREELPKLGLPLATPPGPSPTIAVQTDDPSAIARRLSARKIDVKAAYGVLRISPAIFNSHADMERLLAALKAR